MSSVTASRLGSSSIMIDWSNLANVAPGSGPAARKHTPEPEALTEAWNRLKARFDSGEVGFFNTPTSDDLSQLRASTELARKILDRGEFTDVLLLGIGGSALGPISLLDSLKHRRKNSLRFHFQENPDAVDWKYTLRDLNPARTLVVAVTKSGGTFETMSQFMIALEWLGRERWRSNVVAITDPEKGDLRKLARSAGFPTLDIHPSIGGRFSIFSPVGLFPAALAGLDAAALMEGARKIQDYTNKTAHEKNPLLAIGSHLIRHYDERSVHVCMPYSTMLRQIGLWWVQLWGESLGKDGKGFTPIAAVGATDQHSLLQLLRDGPNDKVTMFLTIDEVEDKVTIPKVQLDPPVELSSFSLLQGHSLHELLNVEYQATSKVLTKNGRPNLTIRLDRLDERSLGSLYYAFSVLTAFTGTLWEVNPFDQPGVEEGKIYIKESLGRRGESEPGYSTGRDEDNNSAVARLRDSRPQGE